jgi:cytidylate kinase
MLHTPIRVITVERECCSMGGKFAHELAEELGWKLLDSELAARAARVAGVQPELAAKYDERLDPWYYRYGKVFWHDSIFSTLSISDDEIFDAERMLGLVYKEILDAAKEGNCVIVGRGAACALKNYPGCFHVFVYAPSRLKREWYAQAYPQHAQRAEQDIAQVDKQRAAVTRKYYQQDWTCRSLYHMLINSAIGVEAMIAAVEGAASLQCVHDKVATE